MQLKGYNKIIMSILSWRARKKLIIFFVVFVIAVGSIALFIYFRLPEPTCFDDRKNQGEEAVDCGGPCDPCVINSRQILTHWTRAFETSEGVYEVAALLENPNLYYGIPSLKYTFRLYDSNNILVALKEEQTFLNPRDRFVVFVSEINTGKKKVVRAIVDVEPLSDWVYLKQEKTPLVVSEKNFSNTPFPTLSVKMINQSLFPARNIGASGVLYDKNGNALGVSSTKIDYIAEESEKTFVFTWAQPFEVGVASSEVLVRINLLQ